jgi:AcrR family transcriptional regulator
MPPASVRTRARSRPAAAAPRAPRRTHAQRREEAEARLLDAALAIVARRGAARMTLAEVGEAAGYSRGLPAHRFGSKAGLVHALAGHIGARFGQQRELGPALAPGLESIVGNIHFYFSRSGSTTASKRKASAYAGDDVQWTATRALLVMMTESLMESKSSALRKEVVDYNRKALTWFERHIQLAITQGEIAPDTNASVTAVILLGAMRGVMLQWLIDDRIALLAVRDQLLQMVNQVLRVR